MRSACMTRDFAKCIENEFEVLPSMRSDLEDRTGSGDRVRILVVQEFSNLAEVPQ